MSRFECDGWLHLTVVSNDSNTLEFSLKHKIDHIPYEDIELPEKWKTYIEENARTNTPGQVSVSGIT